MGVLAPLVVHPVRIVVPVESESQVVKRALGFSELSSTSGRYLSQLGGC